MVITAWSTKAKDDLDRLARDIASAQHSGAGQATVQALYKRFHALQSAATEHTQLLNTSLDDTGAALQLVRSWSAPSWAASSPTPGRPAHTQRA
jgi:hypothetical protein